MAQHSDPAQQHTETRSITELDADRSIDYLPGEERLHVTGRHWILLVLRLLIPIGLIIGCAGLVVYRSIGGSFLIPNAALPGTFDLVNSVLAMALALVALVWFIWWMRAPKQVSQRWWLLGFGGLLALVIYFRYQGGRIFYMNYFAAQPFDMINVILMLITLVTLVYAVYTFFDWANDELVVTSKRVIYDNDTVFIPKLLEKRVQKQIPLEDVQNVSASTKTYLQHWLKYGTIVVKSATIGGDIVFGSAIDPKKMQSTIDAAVKKVRSQRTESEYQAQIVARVYNGGQAKPKRSVQKSEVVGPAFLRWLFTDNPEYDEAKDQFTWRPHWLFQIYALLAPLGTLTIGWLLLIVAARLGMLPMLWLVLSMAIVLIGFVGWAAWEIEDHRNDLYILTPTNVIDIEKKPFGPEDRRTAGLGSIQNVTFKTTFISNLLGYGDVFLETAGGGGKFTFNHVPDPRGVVSTINEYLTQFKKAERERGFNDMVGLLRHYHEEQMRRNEINPEAPEAKAGS